MNKSLIETVIEAVDDKFKELELIRLTRRNRAIAAYAEINNSMEPNEDRNGRLHAPCDGYEDIDGRGLYNKGEFLPIPECVRLEMEMQGIHPNEKVYGSRSRVMVEEKEADDVVQMFVYNYFLPAEKGKVFPVPERRHSRLCQPSAFSEITLPLAASSQGGKPTQKVYHEKDTYRLVRPSRRSGGP